MGNQVGRIYLTFGIFFTFLNKQYLTSYTCIIAMNLLERYLRGNKVQVYDELERMGKDALEGDNLRETKAVLTETMNRVAYNLGIIHAALVDENYCFKKNPGDDFEFPLLKPRWGASFHIYRLQRSVSKFGHVPLSLKVFYKVVGSCNFAWDYDSNATIPWEGADPIQLFPLKYLLTEAEEIDPDDKPFALPVSADFYHKDNISGGPAYSVELTASPQVDSRFLNEEHETTFVNYLRIVMENCGFARAYVVKDEPGFLDYCKKIKPLLKPI